MPYGYNGKILKVDLTKSSVDVEEKSENFYRKYLGGSALASYYLLTEMEGGVDPLSSNNILIFAASVLTGAPVPGFSRYTVAAKSPLTGGFGESEAGGLWGPALKFAGFDAIVVKGRADRPVYLWVHDGEAEIRDASKLWGLTTADMEVEIKRELGDDRVQIVGIGPGGEKLVRYACVIHRLHNANGRTGMGAVMGSKKLKAVAVRGRKKLEFKDKEKLYENAKWFAENFKSNPGNFALYDVGTTGCGIPALNISGVLPTRNFISGYFEEAEKISGERIRDEFLIRRVGCYACPVKCDRDIKFNSEYSYNTAYGTPEYETVGAFGSLCGVSNLKAICKAHEICNAYTIDSISTGVAIAFAMECYEKGILSKEDVGELDLRFGNDRAMVELTQMIAERKGIGDLLAEGVKRAAEKIGKGSEKYAMHVKGQELPLHEPRGKVGVALQYSTSPTGADHLEAQHDPEFEKPGISLESIAPLGILEPLPSMDFSPAKVRMFMYLQWVFSMYNSAGICINTVAPGKTFSFEHLVENVRAVTGWNCSLWELVKAGERTVTLARAVNVREGFTRKDDNLPARMFEPLVGGVTHGNKLDREEFEKALTSYYEMMGWDPENGKPTKAKLDELDIGWVIDKIY